MADAIADPDIDLDGLSTADLVRESGVDWRDLVPDSVTIEEDGKPIPIRAHKSLESFKDFGALAKSYVETKKLVGAKPLGLVPPGDKATPEERSAYDVALRKTLGVPEAPTGYTIKRPDVVLDGGWDAIAEGQFLTAMHKAGAPPAVVQVAIDFYGQFERGKLEHAKAEAAEVGATLRREWGPNYDAKVGRANRAIAEFGGKELDEALTTPGHVLNAAGRHPLMVKAWAAVGDALVEHGAMTGEGLETLSVEESKARAAELRKELASLPEAHPRRVEIIDQIIAVTNAAQRR